jgi:hypothetical protein
VPALQQQTRRTKDFDVDGMATAKAFSILHNRQADSIVAIKRIRPYTGAGFWVRVTVTRLKDNQDPDFYDENVNGARFLGIVQRTLPPSDCKAKVMANGRVFEF